MQIQRFADFENLLAQIRNDKLLNKVALRLKALREQKGLTIEEMYNDTNIHIGRIESAKANITLSTLSKLCDYFEISLTEFFKKIEI